MDSSIDKLVFVFAVRSRISELFGGGSMGGDLASVFFYPQILLSLPASCLPSIEHLFPIMFFCHSIPALQSVDCRLKPWANINLSDCMLQVFRMWSSHSRVTRTQVSSTVECSPWKRRFISLPQFSCASQSKMCLPTCAWHSTFQKCSVYQGTWQIKLFPTISSKCQGFRDPI